MVSVRRLTLVSLLALVPVVAYLTNQDVASLALSVTSVLLIAASLYLMFGPTTGESGDVAA